MTTTRTLVGTPDPDSIRRARLAWIAETLRLPAALAGQAVRALRRTAGEDTR